jgi:hypothetical protein
VIAGTAVLALAATARADPCTAIPDVGPVPPYLQPGSHFSGPVVLVLDGDSLCVAVGPGAANWVEVRLEDFYAPEMSADGDDAKAALQRVAMGKEVVCTAGPQSYDRVVSSCQIGDRSLGDLMRAAGVSQGGRGYRAVPEVREAPAPVMRGASGPRYSPRTATSQTAFRSCAAARAAGAAPLYRGQPGYGPHLDGDGDGVACEPYRGRR